MIRYSACILLFLWILSPGKLTGQWQLSDEGEIHLVTCGPYQGELYSAFGHSAIRVSDPVNGLDLIYNYGVFNFNQPNFYLNFAKGYLNYYLGVTAYRGFVNQYIADDRYVHEQVLDLSPSQKQAVFNFLQWNAQPENREYFYDYFYDNCATRVRDVFEITLQDSLRLDLDYSSEDYTVRELCDLYLKQQPWGDLGIDLCLGLPMDKHMTSYQYMYLPDYVEMAFNNVEVYNSGQWRPIVRETLLTFQPKPTEQAFLWWTPNNLFWSLFVLTLALTYLGYTKNRLSKALDSFLFSVIGLLGWLLLGLWLLTDHEAAAVNYNLLWAIPLHFPVVIILNWLKPQLLAYYFRIVAVFYLLVLILWEIIPQDLHDSLFPLVLLLLVRAFYYQFYHLSRNRTKSGTA